MGPNSMSLRMFLVMFFLVSVVVIGTLTYQNSTFRIFEGFLRSNVQGGTSQNVTTHGFGLRGTIQNIKNESLGKEGNNDNCVCGVQNPQGTSQNEGRTKNITKADDGSKTASLTSSHAANLDDKLLGGLLTSGFDGASCISRMQSYLYRKVSPHKPSPYLISKLRNYEEIHASCGPNSRAYDRSMREIEHSKNNGVATMCKYLIWNPVNGLGNQMISLASTFLYAILTERVLLVKLEKDKHGLFCEPFLNSTWILPENSTFWNQNHIETYQVMLDKDRASNSTEDLPLALFVNLQHPFFNPEKIFHCEHTQDLLRKVPLLILQSDQFYVPSLFMTSYFDTEITKIVFNPESTPKQEYMDLVLSCTLNHKLLPEIGLPNPMSSTGKNHTASVKAVLVVSLYPEFGDNLRTLYLKKTTVSGEVIQVYQPSHEGNQKFNDKMHNMKAWMDIYLLSLSDVLVTSPFSTFGYAAQGLGNLKPWLLSHVKKNDTHSSTCERDFSSEPCYHMPPKHYCNGKLMKDFVSSFPYSRRCKDFYPGMKLGNNFV
uniref:Fucosyltransferase n=1 Tax=Cajanus cajan TaxID=3821 RepID=A0A151SGD5_CAJCA|nr:Galactoside 2-alpha-L-fucosyltransferase [Cajanus cajan]